MIEPSLTIRLILTVSGFIYYVHKALSISKQNNEKDDIYNMLRIATNALLVIVGETFLASYSLIKIPVFRIVGTMFAGYGITLMFFTLDRILNGNHRNIIFTTHFILSTIEMITEMLVDTTLGSNVGSFFHQHPFVKETNYYIRYVVTIFSLFRMQTFVAYLLWDNIRKQRGDNLYTIRRTLGMLGFALPAISSSMSMINLLLTIPYNDLYRSSIHGLCDFISLIGVITLISSILPQSIFKEVFRPIDNIINLYNRAATRFAHRFYITIIPIVHINNVRLSDPDIEIPDARDLIWSNIPHNKPLTSYQEAVLLIDLTTCNRIFDEAGGYDVPPPEFQTRNYTVSVANKLVLLLCFAHIKQLLLRPIKSLTIEKG